MTQTLEQPATKTKLVPMYDKILVKRDSRVELTKQGIYLPETTTEEPMTGVVLAVGQGICNFETGQIVPLPLKVGQRVMFSKYGGMVLKVEEEEHLFMSVMDVVGILEEAKD